MNHRDTDAARNIRDTDLADSLGRSGCIRSSPVVCPASEGSTAKGAKVGVAKGSEKKEKSGKNRTTINILIEKMGVLFFLFLFFFSCFSIFSLFFGGGIPQYKLSTKSMRCVDLKEKSEREKDTRFQSIKEKRTPTFNLSSQFMATFGTTSRVAVCRRA